MNFYVVVVLIALALGVALGYLVQLDPGYIRISWTHWLIETNLWIGFLLFLGFYFTFHVVLKFLLGLLAVKSGYRKWQENRKRNQARKYTRKGMAEYAEGNWQKASRHLSRAASRSEAPLMNYLAAAQAANESGDTEKSRELLNKAYKTAPEGEIAVALTQAQMQLARQENEQAVATLVELRQRHPQHAGVQRLLATAYERTGNWQALGEMLPEMSRSGAVHEQNYMVEQRRVWVQVLRETADNSRRQKDVHNPTGRLNQTWDRVPTALKQDAEAVSAYAEGLIGLEATGHAEKEIRSALKKQWDDRLVRLYGKLPGEDPNAQLEVVENWLKDHPRDAVLYLSAGRLSLACQDWDKARRYLERSIELKASAEASAELGRLLNSLGDHTNANRYLCDGLSRGLDLPALPQPVSRNPVLATRPAETSGSQ